MFCEKCGTKLPEGSRFCMNCGAKASIQETIQDTAVQETAVSADAPVFEAEPAAVVVDTLEAPAAQPALLYEITEQKPDQEQKAQIPVQKIPEQVIQPAQAQTVQPAQAQTVQPAQAKVQQAVPQQTLTQPAFVQAQPRAAVQASQSATAQVQTAQSVFSQNTQQASVQAQQAEAAQKPEKIRPLQTWKFIGMFIITAIPVINLLFVLIWSFSSGFNKNTKSFARAILILWIAGLVLLIITAIVNWAFIQYIWSAFSSMSSGVTPIY